MYNQDDGLGAAMGRSHDRETATKASSIIAATVLKALIGMPVTPAELDQLRKIAAGDTP